MTSWSDIQILAADLKRTQLLSGVKKLSEANCVEIVSKLITFGFLDVVVTTDAKEYVTRNYLVIQVQNECLASNGQISLADCASQLNMEIDHVLTAVKTLVGQSEGEFILCSNELIHRGFIIDLCKRLNLCLTELGHTSIQNLIRQWNISADLLNNYVLKELGKEIQAIRFEDQLYTVQFLDCLKRRLSAVLTAFTKPVQLKTVSQELDVSSSLFFKVWSDLASEDELNGKVIGGKNSLKALYVPTFHDTNVRRYIEKRLTTDSFIESSILKKLAVIDIDLFVQSFIPEQIAADLLFWPSLLLSRSQIWNDCESSAKDFLNRYHFCIIEEIFPPRLDFLSHDDFARAVDLLKRSLSTISMHISSTSDFTVVYEPKPLQEYMLIKLSEWIDERAKSAAQEIHKTPTRKKDIDEPNKREPDDLPGKPQKRKAGGASKKNTMAQSKSLRDKSSVGDDLLPTLNTNEIFAELSVKMEKYLPKDFLEQIADDLITKVGNIYSSKVNEEIRNLRTSIGMQEERKLYELAVNEINELYLSICAFEKGATIFTESLCEELGIYLQRTLCVDMANKILLLFADPQRLYHDKVPITQPNLTSPKVRNQLAATIDDKELRETMFSLFDGLNSSLSQFHDLIFRLGEAGQLKFKHVEKQEMQAFSRTYSNHLFKELESYTNDPPAQLLCLILIIINHMFGVSVHASGKFVSKLIEFLSSSVHKRDIILPEEILKDFVEIQRLVIDTFKAQKMESKTRKENKDGPSEDEMTILNEKLTQLKKNIFKLLQK